MTTSPAAPPSSDLVLELPVDAPPDRVRAAVPRVEQWWSTAVDRAGDEFTVHFAENWTRLRDAGDTWTVTAQDTPALPDPDEWVGDTIRFEVEDTGDGRSRLRLVHVGLLAQLCAQDCRPAWQHYLRSLVALVETGQGDPWRPGLAAAGA